MTIRLRVNGKLHELPDEKGRETLLDYLHDELYLTGTKLCCGIGVCRACTVQVVKGPTRAPMPVISCSTALATLDGAEVSTIESVAEEGQPDAVQQAFLGAFAFQCGYCAPGFVMASRMFLDGLRQRPYQLSEAQLETAMMEAIGSHICRCTGYVRYFEALRGLAQPINKMLPEGAK